jgi:hypothetical protein
MDDARQRQSALFPNPAAADRSQGRLLFALALTAYIAVDIWLLPWIPVSSDTADYWHMFYTSYTELFFNNSFSHWLPYGGYGQSNILFALMEISSTDYLMMFVGKLFRIRNAVLLFQLSLIADHILFLFGIYLLSRLLFKRRSSVIFTGVGSLFALHGGELEFIQVFRILSWYPLIVYFLARFFRERQPEMLWIAGVLFALWCPGTAYMPPYMILAVAPFVAVASWYHPAAWRSILSLRFRNLVMLTVCASIVLLYVYLAREAMVGIEVTKEGRAATGLATVGSFLGTRNHTPFSVLISMFSGGIFYIGLLPIGCLLCGLFSRRSAAFQAFMGSALLLMWFALSGLFALALFYYAPFFAQTHYLFLGFYLMRVPLLLAAAAVWDVFSPSRTNLRASLWLPIIVVFLLDLCLYGDGFVLVGANAETFARLWPSVYFRLAIYGVFAGLALVVWCGYRWARADSHEPSIALASPALFVVVALLAALFADMFQYSYKSGFQTNKYASTYRDVPVSHRALNDTNSELYRAGRVNRLIWQPERLDAPRDTRQRIGLELPSYYHTYAYAQFDPCEFSVPPIVMGASMAKLLALRDKGDGALQTILGCRAPKMRLTTDAEYVEDEKQAASAVQRAPDLAATVILELPRTHRPAQGSSPKTAHPGTVAVTRFTANAITASVYVDDPHGAWLIYADTYDPRWHAWVNDQSTPVVPAYVGLKAVRVPTGDSTVRMEFRSAATAAMNALAFMGAMCSLSLLVYCASCCVRGFPRANHAPSGISA